MKTVPDTFFLPKNQLKKVATRGANRGNPVYNISLWVAEGGKTARIALADKTNLSVLLFDKGALGNWGLPVNIDDITGKKESIAGVYISPDGGTILVLGTDSKLYGFSTDSIKDKLPQNVKPIFPPIPLK